MATPPASRRPSPLTTVASTVRAQSHRGEPGRDPRLSAARERRGF